LSADPNWSGGGYGKYKGLPLKVIEGRFAQCAADPSMRSVSAVLRITREQIEARGELGHQPHLAAFFGGVALILFAGSFFVPATLRPQAWSLSGGLTLAFLAFSAGSFATRHARKMNVEQEREILAGARNALQEILKHGIVLKPLTREQKETVMSILKQEGENPALDQLLQQV
jgi:hypothetical protein